MTDRLLAAFSFLALAWFLGILILYLWRLDLSVVILITLALVAWDFFVVPLHRGKS